jgi:hypothetical protein
MPGELATNREAQSDAWRAEASSTGEEQRGGSCRAAALVRRWCEYWVPVAMRDVGLTMCRREEVRGTVDDWKITESRDRAALEAKRTRSG